MENMNCRLLPTAVNSKGYDFNAYVDPDENYIIFSSYKRSDDLGGGDLYYSLHKNGAGYPPYILVQKSILLRLIILPLCPDHKYFFFTSKRQRIRFPFPDPKSVAEIRELLSSYGNGNDDIYIMNFKIVEEMMNSKLIQCVNLGLYIIATHLLVKMCK